MSVIFCCQLVPFKFFIKMLSTNLLIGNKYFFSVCIFCFCFKDYSWLWLLIRFTNTKVTLFSMTFPKNVSSTFAQTYVPSFATKWHDDKKKNELTKKNHKNIETNLIGCSLLFTNRIWLEPLIIKLRIWRLYHFTEWQINQLKRNKKNLPEQSKQRLNLTW